MFLASRVALAALLCAHILLHKGCIRRVTACPGCVSQRPYSSVRATQCLLPFGGHLGLPASLPGCLPQGPSCCSRFVQPILLCSLALQPLLLPPHILLQAVPVLLAERLVAEHDPRQDGPHSWVLLALQEGCLQKGGLQSRMARKGMGPVACGR